MYEYYVRPMWGQGKLVAGFMDIQAMSWNRKRPLKDALMRHTTACCVEMLRDYINYRLVHLKVRFPLAVEPRCSHGMATAFPESTNKVKSEATDRRNL